MKKTEQMTFSSSGRRSGKGLLWILFLIYLAAMTWIILFKFSTSLDELPDLRSINLIPFHESLIVNGKIDFSEIIMNGVIFVPFGVYLSALFPKGRFWGKLLAFAGTSLFYEVLQYAFSIGMSDITDLILNTAGGCVGVFLYFILKKIFGGERRANAFVKVAALIGTAGMLVLMGILILAN